MMFFFERLNNMGIFKKKKKVILGSDKMQRYIRFLLY